jgi:hypothetical protein
VLVVVTATVVAVVEGATAVATRRSTVVVVAPATVGGGAPVVPSSTVVDEVARGFDVGTGIVARTFRGVSDADGAEGSSMTRSGLSHVDAVVNRTDSDELTSNWGAPAPELTLRSNKAGSRSTDAHTPAA